MSKKTDFPKKTAINLAEVQSQACQNLLNLQEEQHLGRQKKEVKRHKQAMQEMRRDDTVLRMAISETFGITPASAVGVSPPEKSRLESKEAVKLNKSRQVKKTVESILKLDAHEIDSDKALAAMLAQNNNYEVVEDERSNKQS